MNADLLRRWIAAREEFDAAVQARCTMTVSLAEFVPLQLPASTAAPAVQDIVIEVRRGAALVTLRWPGSASADCATWLQGWLR